MVRRVFAVAAAVAWQGSHAVRRKGDATRQEEQTQKGGCHTLTNAGSFSTVEILVGTPPQKINAVADTGSDLILIESCACVDSGSCSKEGNCFRGTNKSSTFHLDAHPKQVTITYGSGPIDTVVASDEVRLGDISVNMDHSIMLIAKNRLEGAIQLEGIFGMGLPHNEGSMSKESGFLDVAKVHRFAMCFNDGGRDGLLRLGGQVAMEKPLQGVGQEHWGIDFRGVTVGDANLEGEASLCGGSLKAGQDTPCGAIVDSGTTLILAPEKHLTSLLAQICDGWGKCKEKSAAIMLNMKPEQAREASLAAKAKALHETAAGCDLSAMPSLHFHVRGKDGAQDTLELTPNDYMIETSIKTRLSQLLGIQAVTKVCRPAFDTHEYNTVKNGAVWLLGTPFFYKYNVAYDRSTSPPSISFNRNGCGSCGGQAEAPASFLAQRLTSLRQLDSAPRVSFINTTRPM